MHVLRFRQRLLLAQLGMLMYGLVLRRDLYSLLA